MNQIDPAFQARSKQAFMSNAPLSLAGLRDRVAELDSGITRRDRLSALDSVGRLTQPNHPWTNGQVERMNRTIKDATVKRYHYDSHDQLRHHLQLFIDAYNHARRLKTLRGLTPYEYVARIWTEEPDRFKIDPYHYSTGPNT